jgi:hypothetical protein
MTNIDNEFEDKQLKLIEHELTQIKQLYEENLQLSQKFIENNRQLKTEQNELSQQQHKINEELSLSEELIANVSKDARNIRQLFGKEFANIISGDLKNFKKQLARSLKEVQYNFFNDFAKKMLIGNYDQNSKGILGGMLFSKLPMNMRSMLDPISLAKNIGNIFKNFTPQARAIGGEVTKNKPYLVGEYGPEIFVPSQHGKVNNKNNNQAPLNINLNITTNNIDEFRQSQHQILTELQANLQNYLK